ncbi:MAG: hypothetical protein R3C05_09430 [Pirellulaceae bacterium]
MTQKSPIDQESLVGIAVITMLTAIFSQSWLLAGLVAISLLTVKVNKSMTP